MFSLGFLLLCFCTRKPLNFSSPVQLPLHCPSLTLSSCALIWVISTLLTLGPLTNKLCHAFNRQRGQGGGGLRIYFSEKPPGNFRNSGEMKFCRFVWHPLEIPKSKTKTHGNSTLVFLNPLELPCFFFKTPRFFLE